MKRFFFWLDVEEISVDADFISFPSGVGHRGTRGRVVLKDEILFCVITAILSSCGAGFTSGSWILLLELDSSFRKRIQIQFQHGSIHDHTCL